MHFVTKSNKNANISKTLNTKNASVVPQVELASARVNKKTTKNGLRMVVKANSHGMFSIYVFCAYVENISSELRYALLFLSTCGKHTK